jgi:hypothetical protein
MLVLCYLVWYFLLSCATSGSAPKAAAVLAGAGRHAGGHCTLLNKAVCGKVIQQVRVVLLCRWELGVNLSVSRYSLVSCMLTQLLDCCLCNLYVGRVFIRITLRVAGSAID